MCIEFFLHPQPKNPLLSAGLVRPSPHLGGICPALHHRDSVFRDSLIQLFSWETDRAREGWALERRQGHKSWLCQERAL